jgi:signal transduction histidine kinase
VTISRRLPSPTLLWWFGTGAAAAIVLVAMLIAGAAAHDVPALIAFLAGTAGAVSLPLALARPVEATVLQFGSVVAFSMSAPVRTGVPWPLPVASMIALLLFVGIVAARHSWRWAAVIWWVSMLLLIVLVLLDPRGRTIDDDAAPTLIAYTVSSLVLLIVALALRHWSGIRRQLADARRDVAVEQSQRAMVEERTRIARELHDVVAHSQSVIHMQASSASYRIAGIDPESKAEFARITTLSRSTIREMRQLLGVLRDESADPSLGPVPGLELLDELVASTRHAGVTVELTAPSAPPELPDTVSTAAYRIVQESLSNVIRHAPGAHAGVTLDVAHDQLVVEVVNAASDHPPSPAGPAGHGLHGMRERVRLLGGALETGPTAAGGFRVSARLPRGDA